MKRYLFFNLIILLSALCAQAQTQETVVQERPAARPAYRSKSDSLMRSVMARGRNKPDSTRTRQPRASWPMAARPANNAANNTPGNTGTSIGAKPAVSAPAGLFSITNIDNNIDFKVTACTGSTHDQTVTVYFTFSNPSKTHQLITMSFGNHYGQTSALDKESNVFAPSVMVLGNKTNTNKFRVIDNQLPTGNTLNGAVTFTNILPSIQQLSQVYLFTESSNWNGGGDRKTGLIEVHNASISWK